MKITKRQCRAILEAIDQFSAKLESGTKDENLEKYRDCLVDLIEDYKSKVTIRAFKPGLKDESKNGREPYAILSYGNVEVELDYTVFVGVKVDSIYCSMEAKKAIDDMYISMHHDS